MFLTGFCMARANRQLTVLVVSADRELLQTTSSILVGAGYACIASGTDETAIETARQSDLDLLICDLNLLGRGGMALWESIKQERQAESLPAMFLSAAQAPDVIRRSDGAGGTYYLRKPFDPEVLLALVEQALAPQRAARCHASPQPAAV